MQASTAKKKKELRPSDARRLAAKMGRSTEWLLFALHVTNLFSTLAVPCYVVETTHAEPVPGFFVVVCTVILWMKLVSYAHCNYDLRCALLCHPPTCGGCLYNMKSPKYVVACRSDQMLKTCSCCRRFVHLVGLFLPRVARKGIGQQQQIAELEPDLDCEPFACKRWPGGE